jgi:hypothetical protein
MTNEERKIRFKYPTLIPPEILDYKEAVVQTKIAKLAEKQMLERAKDVPFPDKKYLRPATPEDIYIGALVWIKDAAHITSWHFVKEFIQSDINLLTFVDQYNFLCSLKDSFVFIDIKDIKD